MDFKEYWELLLTINRDSNREQYYDEIVRPVLKEAAKRVKNAKVVPTFDTRIHSNAKGLWRCVTGPSDNFVWPDYIIVPEEYTHIHPVSPYARVEFKTPNIKVDQGQILYHPMTPVSAKIREELAGELSQSPLIFTDGISWLFLREPEDIKKADSNKYINKADPSIHGFDYGEWFCLASIGEPKKRNVYFIGPCTHTENLLETLEDKIAAFVSASLEQQDKH